MRSICIFCAASDGADPAYAEAAADMGRRIGEAGLRLIYGGGSVGLMGIVARAAKAAGGEVIGVIPTFLRYVEAPECDVTEMHVVETMHARKQMMFDFSDAFISLPGGIGTMDETIEMMTWSQLERHTKPILLVDTRGYWSAFDALMQKIVGEGFARPNLMGLYKIVPDPESALSVLQA
ncbi:Putative cytokinin riboside 5'-monophosphate phosphoribohydrolase [Alphaproteobacteria bacterium SO-S41]|nr:Putative cytokinin riboside 5'-monophosphate phosphoribohydrolase [Alphaproteobacteria bacterium SO-S41]